MAEAPESWRTAERRAGGALPAAVAVGSILVATMMIAGCQADGGYGGQAGVEAGAPAEVGDEALRGVGSMAGAQAPAAGESAHREAAPPPVRRKLVQTVQLTLTVADSEAAAERVEALVSATGGYVSASESRRRSDELLFVTMTLRVPAERLETVVAAVRDLAERVERQQLTTEDVTDRYVDLEARLRALRTTEEELTALLRESRARGHSAEDIMAIFRELTGIRGQIEQIQGQLQQLDDRTTYSTIHLELQPAEAARPLVDEGWRPATTFRNSLRGLVTALQWLADAAIVIVVSVLPILLLIGLAIWLLLRLRGRWRGRRPPPPSAPAETVPSEAP